MDLIKELENYRLENRVTQEKLAEALGVSYLTVHNWLKGDKAPNQIHEYHIKKFLEEKNIVVKDKPLKAYNEAVINSVKSFDSMKNGLLKDMEDVDKIISKRTDLDEKSKKGLYEIINSDDYSSVWYNTELSAKSKVAIAEILYKPEEKNKLLKGYNLSDKEETQVTRFCDGLINNSSISNSRGLSR